MNSAIVWAIKEFSSLPDALRHAFAHFMLEAAKGILEGVQDHHALTPLRKANGKKLLFYLVCFAAKAEAAAPCTPSEAKGNKAKKKKAAAADEDFDLPATRRQCLCALKELLSAQVSALWPMGIVEEAFPQAVWTHCLGLLEHRPAGMGISGSAALAVEVIAKATRFLGSSAFAALGTKSIDAMLRAEHMSAHIADICSKESSGCHLSAELVAELSSMNMSLLSGPGAKHLGLFIEAFAKLSPQALSNLFPVAIKLIDSPAHQIRSAMAAAMGSIVIFVHSQHLLRSDAHSDERNLAQLSRLRDSLLDMLIERTHDVSPYTRAHVLKVWVGLLEADGGALPVRRVGSVAEVAVDRLQDRNHLVRRAALGLLGALLDVNPFAGALDQLLFVKQKDEIGRLVEVRREQLLRESEEVQQQTTTTTRTSTPEEVQGEEEQGGASDDDEEVDEEEVGYLDDPELTALQAKLSYVTSALDFIVSVQLTALPRAAALLSSKIASDVTESLGFLAKAVAFRLQGALQCFSSAALPLVWHSDPAVRGELLRCFEEVYLTNGPGAPLPAQEVAFNLLQLVKGCRSPNALVSLERTVSLCTPEGVRMKEVVAALLHYLGSACAATPSGEEGCSEAAAALQALSMLLDTSSVVKDTSSAVLQAIVRLGLHSALFKAKDYFAIKMACVCVQRLYRGSGSSRTPEEVEQLLALAMPPLLALLVDENLLSDHDEHPAWFCAAEEAVHTVFLLHPRPDLVMTSALQHSYAALSQQVAVPAQALGGFLFLLGQVAVNAVVHIEEVAEEVKKARNRDHKVAKCSEGKGVKEGVEDFEEQMGMAQAQDAEHDRELGVLLEQELVLGNLLGAFLPLLTYIVADDSKAFLSPSLRSAAVLTVCRYMAVSSLACEQLLALAFTVLESTSSEVEEAVGLRTTIMVALGDLAFRFPNSLEPWTDRFYCRLRDGDEVVRYNALLILTHLVLNDMIKVKNQVYQVALSLLDAAEPVRDLAKLFFLKLAERSHNPVYNLLTDIISRLSSSSSPSEDMQEVMRFLLSFVKKDRQADQLLERLLARLAAAEEVRSRRFLAFCISELSISDKGVRRLIEGVRGVRTALLDPEVFAYFELLLSRAKKGPASGTATSVVEGEEGGATAKASTAVGGGAGAGGAGSKALLLEAEKALTAAVSGEEDGPTAEGVQGDEEGSAEAAPSSRTRKVVRKPRKAATATAGVKGKAKGRKRDQQPDSEDDEPATDSDQDEEVVPKRAAAAAVRGTNSSRTAGRKKAAAVNEDEEEEAEF